MIGSDQIWLVVAGLIYSAAVVFLIRAIVRHPSGNFDRRRTMANVMFIGLTVCGVMVDILCRLPMNHDFGHLIATALMVTSVPALIAVMTLDI